MYFNIRKNGRVYLSYLSKYEGLLYGIRMGHPVHPVSESKDIMVKGRLNLEIPDFRFSSELL